MSVIVSRQWCVSTCLLNATYVGVTVPPAPASSVPTLQWPFLSFFVCRPARFGVVLDGYTKEAEQQAVAGIAAARKLVRQDLTHLEAFAIDDPDIAE